ncbi:MAG: DUF4097 family beta strand repeat protein [Gemmatimonadetes bacterium]|nr:DUF4097 family beta strand repeat protein [Gemmatimonadota bacterium]
MRMIGILSFVSLAAFAAAPAAGQDFSWNGKLASGGVLEIKGVNGGIQAEPASGDEIEVTAVKRARRSDPDEVEIKVIEHAGGVTICAVYPTPRRARQENECAPGDGGHMSTENNDVTVDFTVKVPVGVRFEGRTVNGDVDADAMRSDVALFTVNGGIRVSTSGYAAASTVNGSIVATMGRADWSGDVDFRTVNGGITLTLPEDLSTEVRAETVNGEIESDFPLTVTGRFGPRRVRGTIGNGGRRLELGTVNGSIRLRRSP